MQMSSLGGGLGCLADHKMHVFLYEPRNPGLSERINRFSLLPYFFHRLIYLCWLTKVKNALF